MPSPLANEFAARIASGLTRKSINSCSSWARAYRILGPPFPGRWTTKHHPWLDQIMDDPAETVVFMKGAQIGASESALNRVFHALDIRRTSVLYVLPSSTPDAARFTSGRFNPALDMSPHIKKMFTGTDNVSMKQAGEASLYIGGSRAPSGLKSVPCGQVVLDEVDEFDPAAAPKIFERLSGQVEKSAYLLSTPTLPGKGIDYYFQDSTKQRYHFRCPGCSRMIRLTWPDSIVITADSPDDARIRDTHYICTECKCKLDHAAKIDFLAGGKWVADEPQRDYSGYHLSQMYSMTVEPQALAKMYIRGQSDTYMQTEFMNQKLGMTHTVEGAKVTDAEINACLADYNNGELGHRGLVTMGIDVGAHLHYCLVGWELPHYTSGIDLNIYASARLLKFGKVRNFEDIDPLIKQWGVRYFVVDAQPERRKSVELCNRFYGMGKCCVYSNGSIGRTLGVNDAEQTVSVDRTLWLDLSLGRVRRGKPFMIYPRDIDHEFRSHIAAMVREYRKSSTGEPVGIYSKPDRSQDHFAHAFNYAEIALPLAASVGRHSDIVKSVT